MPNLSKDVFRRRLMRMRQQKEGSSSPGIQKKPLPFGGRQNNPQTPQRRNFPVVGKGNPTRTPPIYNNPNSSGNQLRNLQNARRKQLPERYK
jgi:hypothetical protein